MGIGLGLNDLNNDGRVHFSEMGAILAANGDGLAGFEKLFVLDVDFTVSVEAEVKVFDLFGYLIYLLSLSFLHFLICF